MNSTKNLTPEIKDLNIARDLVLALPRRTLWVLLTGVVVAYFAGKIETRYSLLETSYFSYDIGYDGVVFLLVLAMFGLCYVAHVTTSRTYTRLALQYARTHYGRDYADCDQLYFDWSIVDIDNQTVTTRNGGFLFHIQLGKVVQAR